MQWLKLLHDAPYDSREYIAMRHYNAAQVIILYIGSHESLQFGSHE